ncbi:DUF4865 domain-containing protein [Mesorhizobium sp. L-8-10]|uniref:DUF4865 family protein n=1 Tax=unclassified Mesorhizobium TaxID=325217 RepID=UPI0019287142|nr:MULTISPECIES: DUF4865 family protein [unclassified Mesorhizobium]BCH21743.1 DUF4865 domain-containing protein [Mesorhizobium sp. L-8-3]BCH29430.1 DUF4865 domain-containing protein [Mesorhizobium sp. L-8-10]
MFMMQYTHRLPADYEMGRIRERAGLLGKTWDDTKGLGFKVFLAQERGNRGAVGNSYASLYLWLEDEAAVDFIADDRFKAVTGTFGRPAIETWLPFALHLGRACEASALHREDLPIDAGADIAAVRHAEGERNMALARRAGTFAAITAIDFSSWRLSRFLLSAQAVDRPGNGLVHEVLHLAKPGMPALLAAA